MARHSRSRKSEKKYHLKMSNIKNGITVNGCGWGTKTRKGRKAYMIKRCSLCKNDDSIWILRKRTTWITLFYIPIIPYDTDYCLECHHCEGYIPLSKTDFENCKREIEEADKIPKSDREAIINLIRRGNSFNA